MATTRLTTASSNLLDNITDPTIKAKIKELLNQADLSKTITGDADIQASLAEVLNQNSNDGYSFSSNYGCQVGWLCLNLSQRVAGGHSPAWLY